MKNLTNKNTFGGDIWNYLVKRKLHPAGMVYKDNGWVIRIPKVFPLWNGIIVLIYHNHSGVIEIWKHSGFSKWFKNTLLENIDCKKFDDSRESYDTICEIIERHAR
jgi:hypothetical protein